MKRLLLTATLAGMVFTGSLSTANATVIKAVVVVAQDDARLERTRLERAYLGHAGGPAMDGLQAALKDAKLELDGAGITLSLEAVTVSTPQAATEVAKRAEQSGAAVLLTDLSSEAIRSMASAVKVPVINLAESDDRLRQEWCRPRLLHTAVSERMRSDALAQTLLARRWTNVLLLIGPTTTDAARALSVQASIKRYGLKVSAQKAFKLSADPRERDAANTLLLTQGAHDVVWVIDSDGEFARMLPYRTATPRPVVGDAGLVAVAWHAQYDRYGATQVSRRFARAYQRAMTGHDWAAYIAGKALVAAALASPKGPVSSFQKALMDVEVDGSKGVMMGFRPWDGQLRQPLFLSDGQGVVATAPVDGVLHPKNALDTLGADSPERLCRSR